MNKKERSVLSKAVLENVKPISKEEIDKDKHKKILVSMRVKPGEKPEATGECHFCHETVYYDKENSLKPDKFCCNECFYREFVKGKDVSKLKMNITEESLAKVAEHMIENLSPKEARELIEEAVKREENYAM